MTNVAGTGSDVQTKKYTKFIIALVDEITSDIFDKLKYALHYVIPSATMEKLLNPLDLFKELEKRHIVGPENLDELRDYLEMIQEQDLMFMLDNFACSCGISRSKATAKKPLKNYLIMNHYYLKIKGGQHYSSESVGEYVELTSGNSYALVVKNPLFHRCRCTIKIDGHVVFPGYIINPRQSVTIERPCQRNGKFRFFSLEHAPSGSGINKWKSENGLVEVTFTPERADMTVVCRVSNENCSRCLPLTCSNQTTDVGLLKMILSAFHFLEAMAFSVHFGCKPMGQRNIKLTEYGLHNSSEVEIKLGLIGGVLHVPPSVTQQNGNDNGAPKWIPGATTLQGESEQIFAESTQSDDFVPDQEKSTTLYLRLVARADDNRPVSNEDQCTPLARETLIPPPVGNW